MSADRQGQERPSGIPYGPLAQRVTTGWVKRLRGFTGLRATIQRRFCLPYTLVDHMQLSNDFRAL